jgi:hypothetical protein
MIIKRIGTIARGLKPAIASKYVQYVGITPEVSGFAVVIVNRRETSSKLPRNWQAGCKKSAGIFSTGFEHLWLYRLLIHCGHFEGRLLLLIIL